MNDKDQVKKILKDLGIIAKKSLGQNFFIDQDLLESIIDRFELNPDAQVIEIGTGTGVLTKILAKKFKKVYSIEIDDRLQQYLTDEFASFDNVELIFNDIMSIDPNQFEPFEDDPPHTYIIANIPYNLATPILLRFLPTPFIEEIYFLVQKEMGQRIITDKSRTASTYIMTYYGAINVLEIISRNKFYPIPNVDSIFIHFKRNKNAQDPRFEEFIKKSFATPRKLLFNNLVRHYAHHRLEEGFKYLNISRVYRPADLTLEQMHDLYIYLEEPFTRL